MTAVLSHELLAKSKPDTAIASCHHYPLCHCCVVHLCRLPLDQMLYTWRTESMNSFCRGSVTKKMRVGRLRCVLPWYCFPGHVVWRHNKPKTCSYHWGGTPALQSWARGGDTYGARQRRLCVSSCSLLPPCTAKTSHPSQHPCMPPHFTPISSPPTPVDPIAISILAINCLSGTCRWASPQ